jgi:predicted nuclease of predicted toxin-antitoxin system
MLNERGHDVLSASDSDPFATDETLLALAYREQRVLITEDKDYGELVFVRRLQHPCIVRFVDMQVSEKVSAMLELIEHNSDAMREGTLVVVTQSRVRIRHGAREQGTIWQ